MVRTDRRRRAVADLDPRTCRRRERGAVMLRPFGRTGVDIAPVVLGAMNFGDPIPPDDASAMIDRALARGITMIDTADVYGNGASERIVGVTLAANGRRDDVRLATKVGMPGGDAPAGDWHRRERILSSCDESLRRL